MRFRLRRNSHLDAAADLHQGRRWKFESIDDMHGVSVHQSE